MFTKKIKLIPFRHQWTVSHFDWLCSDAISGRPELRTKFHLSDGKKNTVWIQLCLWPNIESNATTAEWVSVGLKKEAGWLMYAKVTIAGDTESERVVCGRTEKNLTIDQYLSHSKFLRLLSSDKELTIYCEGVIYNHKKYDPQQNLDDILQLIATTSVTSSRFSFQPPLPSSYLTTKWTIDRLVKKNNNNKPGFILVSEKNSDSQYQPLRGHWIELDEHCATFVQIFRSYKADGSEYLSVAVQNASFDNRKVVSCCFKLLDAEGKTRKTWYSARCFATKNWKRECAYFASKADLVSPWSGLISSDKLTLTLQIEVLSFEDGTVDNDPVGLLTLDNYQTIHHHLSDTWKKNASLSATTLMSVSPKTFSDQLVGKLSTMITTVGNSKLLAKCTLSTKLPLVQLHMPFERELSQEILVESFKTFFEKILPNIVSEALTKATDRKTEGNRCYVSRLKSWTADATGPVKFTFRVIDLGYRENEYDVEGCVDMILDRSAADKEVEIKDDPKQSKPNETKILSNTECQDDFKPTDETLPSKTINSESTISVHPPLPDLETLYAWASMYAFGNLEEIRRSISIANLESIGQQAKRYLDKYQESRQAADDEACIKTVQLAKLVKIQTKELLASRELKSKPVRYVLAEHVTAGSDIE